MWTPLTLAAALAFTPAQSPAPAGTLNLTNVRATYGELGGNRPPGKLLPGEVLWVGFDIEGLTIAPDGQANYAMASEFLTDAGKLFRKDEPFEMVSFVPLGGNKVPGRAFVVIGTDQPAGGYVMKLTVTDKATKATKTLEYKFEVAEPGFGIVAVYACADPDGRLSAPTTGVVGQPLFVQFMVIGFQFDGGKRQPNVQVEMVPIDESGKPTLPQPLSTVVETGVDEKDARFTLRFPLPLTRVGKFTIRLKATDKLGNKTATFDLPIAVIPPAN